MTFPRLSGIRAFLALAIGQSISLTGSAMTQFALGIWVWQQTGEATPFAWIALANALPVLLSPITGALVDRWDRKLTMMLSDLGAGIVTLIYFLLFSTGNLQIWHLYIGAFITSLCAMFQWPAYSAAISVMVPKEQYTRASALQGLAESLSGILAPSLGAALVVAIGIQGVMAIDIISFLAAFGTLILIVVPRIERRTDDKAMSNPYAEMSFGFRYIFSRPSLLGLQLVFFFSNFMTAMALTLVVPMILARTDNNEQLLGAVQTIMSIGALIGGTLLGIWGGPKRRVYGLLSAWALYAFFRMVVFSTGTAFLFWAVTSFIGALVVPMINGSNQAIWMAKVPPDIQGKVFSIRRMIAWGGNWIAALVVGPLADNVFEPAMREGGTLTGVFGGLVGTGAGAGMALMTFFAGIGIILVQGVAYFTPAIRNAERLMPDHDTLAAGGE